MMKRILWLSLLIAFCSPLWGDILDDYMISVGEYEYGMITWRSYDPALTVNGGGRN